MDAGRISEVVEEIVRIVMRGVKPRHPFELDLNAEEEQYLVHEDDWEIDSPFTRARNAQAESLKSFLDSTIALVHLSVYSGYLGEANRDFPDLIEISRPLVDQAAEELLATEFGNDINLCAIMLGLAPQYSPEVFSACAPAMEAFDALDDERRLEFASEHGHELLEALLVK